METYNKSRLEILYYITNFHLAIRYHDELSFPITPPINRGILPENYFENVKYPNNGDLIVLKSAPVSKWYMSWYIRCNKNDNIFSDDHLLQSIEDGELCNWRNVSFIRINPEIVNKHPEWRWTDTQWKFKERWFSTCYKKRDAYITLPKYPVFEESGSVWLGTRKRWGNGSETRKKFTNWKKVRIKDMLDFYDQSIGGDEYH